MKVAHQMAAFASAAAVAAALSLAAAAPAGASPSHAWSRAAAAGGARSMPAAAPLSGLRIVKVQGPPLSPRQALNSGATITLENYYNSALCLDANDSGSTAGQNGDKVQLWTCSGKANQSWTLYKQGSAALGDFTLYNDKYPSKCLNADDSGGLANGRKVQLWTCGTTSNFYWYVGSWSICLESDATCVLYLNADNYQFVLDARSQSIGNGDQVQIWNPTNQENQFWICIGSLAVCPTY